MQACPRHDGELARGIGAGVGLPDLPRHGGDIDQGVAALCLEVGQHRPRAVHVAKQVGLDDPMMNLERRILETAQGIHARVGNPDIDATEGLDYPVR